jgi:hypothetical protein
MIAKKKSSLGTLLLLAASVAVFLFLTTPTWGQNVPVDLTSTCSGGSSCFNTAGLFTTGTTFEGTSGMDNGFNCTITGLSNCPDAYSATQLGLPKTAPFTLTPPSLNVPFIFGPVNSTNCGPTPPNPSGSPTCILDTIALPTTSMTISLPAAQQAIYSTLILLGSSVNGSQTATITVAYADGSTSVFNQTLSDWCGFAHNTNESIAVGPMNRINANGTLNGASCYLYAYTYSLNFTSAVTSFTVVNTQTNAGNGPPYVLAATLKPPTYTIDAGTASPTSIKAGSTSTATITVNPQPGYTGTIQLSCNISPQIPTNSASTAPTCSLSPTSVTVTAGAPAPTTTLTFSAAAPPKTSSLLFRSSRAIYAFWLPIPGLALIGLGFGSLDSRKKKWFGGVLLGILLAGAIVISGCVNYVHLGNVGTPPGPYIVTVTGLDSNNLSQASNASGTTNEVVVTVTQ